MTDRRDENPGPLRVVVLTSLPPGEIERIVERLGEEAPSASVVAILFERPGRLPLGRRIRRFIFNVLKPEFLAYAGGRFVETAGALARSVSGVALGLMHGTTFNRTRPGPGRTLEDLGETARRQGAQFLIVDDIHSEESLEFVRSAEPDLGMVLGTRILKRKLFEIPRLGSVNIHKRKLPDYRGSGPVGLWELLEGEQEIEVTIHRVVRKVDAGSVIARAPLAIQPYDTLESLAAKADMVGEDLLVEAIRRVADGTVRDTPLEGKGRLYRRPEPHRLRSLQRRVARKRPKAPDLSSRPAWKLIVRLLLFAAPLCARNWRRRLTGTFPVVVLYHHLVSDRDHYMAITTSKLLEQIRFLSRHYDVVPVHEAVRQLESGRIERPTVVLTFDDGYAENVLNLRAVTEATGIPVTHFVCTEHLASGAPFDHDLRKGIVDFAPMSWDDARLLARRGATFGSHTRTHCDCGSEDEEQLTGEIVASRAEAERELGAPIDTFSYPWGKRENISGMAESIASEAYRVACSAFGGANRPAAGQAVRHLVRRDHPNGVLELELALQGVLEIESKAP